MRELRAVALKAPEVRATTTDDVQSLQFTGHAAVFEQRTWIGPPKWGFFETVERSFFDDVLSDDAVFLVNHDPNIVLARNGLTMSLAVDDMGLRTDADFDPADPDAVKWAGRVKRGDVTKMSFAFEVGEDRWEFDEETGVETRFLVKAKRLWDTSLVTYPAYDGTDAAVRDGAAEVLKRHREQGDPRGERREGDEPPAYDGPSLALRWHRLIAARHRLSL